MSQTLERGERTGAGENPVKRQQILAGAQKVFVTMGFDAASMDDVTRAAGVSKSTLYVYFRSKEELFTALIAEERERYFAEVSAIFTDPGHPAETLKIYGTRLATKLSSKEVIRAQRTVMSVVERMPELGASFYESGPKRTIGLLSAYLDSAVAAGTLRIEDTELAAKQFIELASAGMLRCRLFGYKTESPAEEEIERTVNGAVRLFMAGYGVPA
ncbi:TetR family transcriptional regulator [Aureimonas endophytica]|uniref:TetR family transcriptional regulator n=1 Tax=Aureimonas endophytica TaxID=2027858 RepID=A0A916ZGQ6_9HYPH|nr:TetR/AcrR family transcriptional regulator [Aureimonas endophytica]GGD96818.1 TetR family transcriptional regulator [Aureimonas endophytica]